MKKKKTYIPVHRGKPGRSPPEKATGTLSEGEIAAWEATAGLNFTYILLLKHSAQKRASSPERNPGEMGLLMHESWVSWLELFVAGGGGVDSDSWSSLLRTRCRECFY